MAGRAFTLIELVVVIAIIGIVALLAMPRLSGLVVTSKYTGTHAKFRSFSQALDLYYGDHMAYPPNAAIATTPPELAGYVAGDPLRATPGIGRAWDWNGEGTGVLLHGINLSIHTTTAEEREEMERRFDDGDPSTGWYRNETHYLVKPMGGY